ncbi:hypothetical protein HB762_07795 [Vibrio campbellii]|uniref:Type I restriction modification DNA specificity domain-containing protein n=1 Tax=Vibrio campbellii TaxID=680 RepID=A0ABY5IC90_9VIBR|nr:hypothetical protein [Vibrio campbellii]UTZ31307.1 hypothetical protein HB762_07795 [Vibrio campbellii]
MAVDSERETFHINKVLVSSIEDFLTAQTYRPAITEAYTKIQLTQFSQLSSLTTTNIRQGKTPVFSSEGAKCLKSSQTRSILLDEYGYETVNPSAEENRGLVKLENEDLVITRQGAGTIGRISIFLSLEEYFITDSLFIVRLDKKKVDPCYVAAFFRTDIGQRLIEKGVYGSTGQLNLSSEHIKKLPVSILNFDCQKYIGNKIRQAEMLRGWATRLEGEFNKALQNEFPDAFENKPSGKKYSRATPSDINYTLNPGAFDEERIRVQRYLIKNKGVKFSTVAQISGESTTAYTSETTYIGLNSISSNSCQLSPSTIENEDVKATCRLLTEGPVIAKLRPYLNKVSYIPQWLKGSVGSTELMCIEPKSDLTAWYLYGVLKSEATLKQIRPVATGATHPRIDKHDLNEVIIPVLAEQESLGLLLEKSQKAYFESSRLIETAKLLVESIIEGKVTESEFVAAQQALENGNNTKDKAIMSKLTEKGYALTDAKPLFLDLEALYELLNEAQQDMEQY